MFSLIELPYQSLAPVISDQTLGLHHGKSLLSFDIWEHAYYLNRLAAYLQALWGILDWEEIEKRCTK